MGPLAVVVVLVMPLVGAAAQQELVDMGRANAICRQDRSWYDSRTCGRPGQPPCWTGHYCQQSMGEVTLAHGECYWKEDAENRDNSGGLCLATWVLDGYQVPPGNAPGVPEVKLQDRLPTETPAPGSPNSNAPGILRAFANPDVPPADPPAASVPAYGRGLQGYFANVWSDLEQLAWGDSASGATPPPAEPSPSGNLPYVELPPFDFSPSTGGFIEADIVSLPAPALPSDTGAGAQVGASTFDATVDTSGSGGTASAPWYQRAWNATTAELSTLCWSGFSCFSNSVQHALRCRADICQ